MAKFLGEEVIQLTPNYMFYHYQKHDWVLYFIEHYGDIAGDHHKAWLNDQIARICNDTSVIVKVARWDDGNVEYRVSLAEPTDKYHKWVEQMRGEKDENGEYEYEYDCGIAP